MLLYERVRTIAMIFDFDDEKWEQEKREWKRKIEEVTIPPDMEQGAIHILQHKLDKYYTEGSWYLTHYEIQYKNLEEMIEAIKKKAGKDGKNDKEREANSFELLMNYPVNDQGKTINLIVALNQLRERYYFYKNFVIKNISKKDSRLMTGVGAGKIEATLAGRPGV